MGKMGWIHKMLSSDCSVDMIAWYLLRETQVSDWYEAKDLAKRFKEEFENEQNESIDE